MADELWTEALPAFGAAALASWVFLLCRYRGAGRPFGARLARAWSLAVIAVMAVVATVLGLGLPSLVERIPPVTVSLLTPATLLSRRLTPRDEGGGAHPWFEIVTGGLRLLLDRLEQQMAVDRDAWCDARIMPRWSLEQIEDAAIDVYETLCRRVREPARKQRLRSDYDAVLAAVDEAASARADRARRHGRHAAEQALRVMLGRGYDWGHTDLRPAPLPAQRSARRRLTAAPSPPRPRQAGRQDSPSRN